MEVVEIASCDSQGAVYILNNIVYRVIEPKHDRSINHVINTIRSAHFDSIVKTEICTDKPPFIEKKYPPETMVLKHKKITYISYPHEWCASMLQDAALFHLDLSVELLRHGLFLKDSHPWNIMFENGIPIFIDFTSIVTQEDLFKESYLESNSCHYSDEGKSHLTRVIHEIFKRMYQPYFMSPLAGYAFGRRPKIRKAIENSTLNASTSIISFFDSLPELRPHPSTIVNSLKLLMFHQRTKRIMSRLVEKNEFSNFYQEMRRNVNGLDVTKKKSAYTNYYRSKGEGNDWTYSENWNQKQKIIYNALNSPTINTVVDVACNTGWYAVLAAKLGKNVVAFDIDEACIEILYEKVKNEQLNIMPLVLNISDLNQDRYSIYDGKKILINANQRLRSDMVIALGIIHHLILGMGFSFEAILNQLSQLCEKQFIIEFVDTEDEMIQNEPNFFPAYFRRRNTFNWYKLQNFIETIETRGFKVSCEKSYPETRTILVCIRQSS